MSGTLVYLVGASGSGKDSILNYIAEHYPERCTIAKRYITRPISIHDNAHIALTEEAFRKLTDEGQFAMHWRANGYYYGINKGIFDDLNSGKDVIVNGSRAYTKTLENAGFSVMTVHIEVDEVIWQQRLVARGRESNVAIEERLRRHRQLVNKYQYYDARIYNNDSVKSAANQLIYLIDNTKN